MDGIIFAPIARKTLFRTHEASFRDYAAFTVVDDAIETAIKWAKEGESFPHDLPGPVASLLAQIEQSGVASLYSHPSPPTPATAPETKREGLEKIGIVGAGATGLYAAMILQSLNIDYEILEANNRVGGRLFTYRFNGDEGLNAPIGSPARYDYFDVGAMRFPKIPFMKRVFDLFDELEITDLLVDYKLSDPLDNTLRYFNTVPPLNHTVHPVEDKDDYFRVSVKNGGTVPNHFVQGGIKHWINVVYDPFKEKFKGLDDPDLTDEERSSIFASAWAFLAAQDNHTTRSVMRAGSENVDPYPNSVIEWLETFAGATGLYDNSFVDSVIDSLDLDWPWPKEANPEVEEKPKKTQWYCIDGGADHISRKMTEKLTNKPILNKMVTKIYKSTDDVNVSVVGERTPRNYSQVISTVPLGCLAAIDTEGCDLLYSQKQAIRSLAYDAATKVGIKFETRWWQDPNIMGTATIHGGTSSTDIPIRSCVYPSYGVNCDPAPGILLASFSIAQDALRLGSISSELQDSAILDLTLDNLAKLHNIPREKFGPVLDFYAHSFYADPYARGAYARFGPGQFGCPGEQYSMFASMKAPAANGKLHIAGEATSVHHASLLGALNSAWRAVYNALQGHPDLQNELIKLWGIPDEDNEVHLKWLCALAGAEWL